MKHKWSPEAIDDLVSLRAQISIDDPAAPKRVALHILHCVEELLSQNPQLGHPGRVPGRRELVIPKTPFVVPYRVSNTTLEVLRVYHHTRRGDIRALDRYVACGNLMIMFSKYVKS
jgi:plasmid stabilization system protein ParE